MSLMHLGQGSLNPPLKKGTLRLYSSVFSPFSQRVRLVLAAKQIPYEVVNINLTKKPAWYLELNPVGQVPCLQHDGWVYIESLQICGFLDDTYPDERLTPSDPYKRENQRLVVESFAPVIADLLNLIKNSDADSSNFLTLLDTIENKLVYDFFGGHKPLMVDYMLWPFIERFPVLKILRNLEIDANRFPKLTAYTSRMFEQPAVKETCIPPHLHAEFMEKFLTGKTPDYDRGLTPN